ncbi:MAG: flagellar hook-basal body complex protein [Clostridia bacterium]|jgi:flagellar basal body rod protein FlgG
MEIGLQQLGKSLLSLNTQFSVISNNIANSVTDRYKGDTLTVRSFSDYFIQEDHESNKEKLFDLSINTDFTQGELYESDASSFALDGNGFITVRYQDNTYYSRGGALNVDNEGYLVDQHGAYILGSGGMIFADTKDISISSDGNVLLDGIYADTLQVVDFEDYSRVSKTGMDYYSLKEGAVIIDTDAKIKQGYSEKSNVSMTNEYLRMMDISNKFETNQVVIQILDEMNGKTINTIAAF